jgi:hypothetical protein
MSENVANYSAEMKQPQAGLWQVLWAELKPSPGRDLAALRMAIACTALVLLSNTFRLPFQDVMPFLALLTAKEEKITTAISAILTLLAITVSVGAAILVFKCTGNRPEFRIPGMAVEIFVGMYLFRILSIGPPSKKFTWHAFLGSENKQRPCRIREQPTANRTWLNHWWTPWKRALL